MSLTGVNIVTTGLMQKRQMITLDMLFLTSVVLEDDETRRDGLIALCRRIDLLLSVFVMLLKMAHVSTTVVFL